MGDATAQTVFFMIGIRFHSLSYLRNCARAAVIWTICGRMICFRMTRITMAA